MHNANAQKNNKKLYHLANIGIIRIKISQIYIIIFSYNKSTIFIIGGRKQNGTTISFWNFIKVP